MRAAVVLLFLLLAVGVALADHDRLERAAWSGSVEAVRAMLEAGADPNPPQGHAGRVALVSATDRGHVAVVELLLAHGADPERRDQRGDRALLVAARKVGASAAEEYRQIVRILLSAGASPNLRRDPFGTTPLMRAVAMGGDEATARMLLAAGADVERATWSGHTALHSAADDPAGAEMVRLLLGAGAGARPRRDSDGATPLHLAAARGPAGSVELLLDAGARIDAIDRRGQRPLHRAAMNANVPAVEALLRLGALPDARDHQGRTPLVAAIETARDERGASHLETIELLAGRSRDLDGALAAALWRGHARTAGMLLAAGASPTGRDTAGRGALAAAAALDDPRWFALALDAGADLVADGSEALAWAARAGHADRVGMLLRLGVPVDGRDGEGTTAFVRAASHGHAALATSLFVAGANPFAVDRSGRGITDHMALVLAPIEAAIEQAGQSRAWIDTSELRARRDVLKRAHAAIRLMTGLGPDTGTGFAR